MVYYQQSMNNSVFFSKQGDNTELSALFNRL
jgi:hypothetical protein